jgi:hypothetical protein
MDQSAFPQGDPIGRMAVFCGQTDDKSEFLRRSPLCEDWLKLLKFG